MVPVKWSKIPYGKELGIEAPSLAEAYRSIYKTNPAGPAWEAEKVLVAGYSLTRLLGFSPKTLPALVADLRRAFEAMGRDPAFIAEWEKSQGSPRRLVRGEESEKIAMSILKAPGEAVNILTRLAHR